VEAIAAIFLSTYPTTPPFIYKTVEASYVFLLPKGGYYRLGYYDPQGYWHNLGTYNKPNLNTYIQILYRIPQR
jgi:hypothetical protein